MGCGGPSVSKGDSINVVISPLLTRGLAHFSDNFLQIVFAEFDPDGHAVNRQHTAEV